MIQSTVTPEKRSINLVMPYPMQIRRYGSWEPGSLLSEDSCAEDIPPSGSMSESFE